MKISTQLTFNGNCEEAFKFYEKALGGKIQTMMKWGESPMGKGMPAEMAKKVIHASIVVAGHEIGGGDAPPDQYEKPQGSFVCIGTEDVKEAERFYKALSEKGREIMPLGETFWAKRFGMCVDRFGTPWMVNCGKPQHG